MKRKTGVLFFSICVLYYLFLVFQKNILAEIFQFILLMLVLTLIYKAFFQVEKNAFFKLSGFFFCVAILFRMGVAVVCELSLILPDGFSELNNGTSILRFYLLSNLCLILSLGIYGYLETRNWNRLLFFLDIVVLSVALLFCIWVIIDNSNEHFSQLIYQNKALMLCFILDVILLTWNFLWMISMPKNRIFAPQLFIAIGSSIYVLADFVRYYLLIEKSFDNLVLIAALGQMGFVLMGIGALLKRKQKEKTPEVSYKSNIGRLWKDAFIVVIPAIVFFIQHNHPITNSTISLTLMLFLYFIFSEYVQMNIHKDERLEIQRQNVVELEKKVKERTNELMWISHIDLVTGLFNRRYFEEKLEKMCFSSKEDGDCLTLFYIEVNKQNNFKSFYGRETAERIMMEIAQILRALTIKEKHVIASYGESVFVIATKQLCSIPLKMEYAKEIITACSKNYQVNNHEIVITLNVGISCFPHQAKSAEELLSYAELALIQAKEEGNNQMLLYNEKIGQHLNKKNQLEMLLKQISFEEEFKLFYQPQVNATTGELMGFEALIRWFSKSRGLIPPLEFIPTAEETGVIVPLGYYIMEVAAKQLEDWKKMTSKKITMAVNVSSKQLSDQDFPFRLEQVLKKYHLAPNEFEIEITENISLGDNDMVKKSLSFIEELGVPIAIDDFGTGYSSLIYLKNLNIHRIKIAKELVDNIENDSYDRTIIQMVVQIAKERNIRVIAEGVESKEQWECLKQIGCNEIQGYYFSKPLPANEVEQTWI